MKEAPGSWDRGFCNRTGRWRWGAPWRGPVLIAKPENPWLGSGKKGANRSRRPLRDASPTGEERADGLARGRTRDGGVSCAGQEKSPELGARGLRAGRHVTKLKRS